MDVVLDIDGGFLGLHEEFALPADLEGIVGRFGYAADLQGIFDDHIAVIQRVAVLVVDVPPEGLKERVEEFLPELGFVVLAGAIGVAVSLEGATNWRIISGTDMGSPSQTGWRILSDYIRLWRRRELLFSCWSPSTWQQKNPNSSCKAT